MRIINFVAGVELAKQALTLANSGEHKIAISHVISNREMYLPLVLKHRKGYILAGRRSDIQPPSSKPALP